MTCADGDSGTHRVVLVCLDDGFWTLPGGQVEPGETLLDTLVREVREEACARVVRARYLACQHVWDPQAPAGPTSHYQARFWARVEPDPWRPRHETVARSLVAPALVASQLSWADNRDTAAGAGDRRRAARSPCPSAVTHTLLAGRTTKRPVRLGSPHAVDSWKSGGTR